MVTVIAATVATTVIIITSGVMIKYGARGGVSELINIVTRNPEVPRIPDVREIYALPDAISA